MKNEILRKCRGCSILKNRDELIKITRVGNDLFINPNSKTFGRSVYVCKNEKCIKALIKNKGIKKALKFNNEAAIKDVENKILSL